MHSCTCNIKVCCRIKPTCTTNQNKLPFKISGNSVHDTVKETTYHFDHVFDANVDQPELFQRVGKLLVGDILEGYNGTILAYGQTGSGKTYTVLGDYEHSKMDGIIPTSLEYLFERIRNSPQNLEFTVKVSFLEIYMEQIRDLLNPSEQAQNLQIHQDMHGTAAWPRGLSSFYVVSAREAFKILKRGNELRSVSSTKMNQSSSRSHSIFQLVLTQRDSLTNHQKQSKLTFVDLAGSERVGKSGASGKVLEEAKKINKSLSSLGNVINALTCESSTATTHIPYRDSKLTRILQDALGGNSKTFLVVTLSPGQGDYDESVSTLRFGERAKSIKNQAIINVQPTEEELLRELDQARKEIAELKQKNEHLQERMKNSPKMEDNTEKIIVKNSNSPSSSPQQFSPIDAKYTNENIEEMINENQHLLETVNGYREKNQILANEINQLRDLLEISKQNEQKLQTKNDSLTDEITLFQKQEQQKLMQHKEKRQSLIEKIALIEEELNDFHEDEYSSFLELNEQEMKDVQNFVQTTLSKVKIHENDSNSAIIYSPSFDCSLSATNGGNETDEIRNLQKGLLIQAYEFDKVKRILMKDLQDRCEKVIELEIQLDSLQAKQLERLQQTDENILQQKIEIMESNLKNVLQRQSEMQQKNLEFSDTIETLEMKLNAKNDQVTALEVIISELSGQLQQFNTSSNDTQVQVRSPHNFLKEYSIAPDGDNGIIREEGARIRRPMTGGSQFLSYYDEDETCKDAYYY